MFICVFTRQNKWMDGWMFRKVRLTVFMDLSK